MSPAIRAIVCLLAVAAPQVTAAQETGGVAAPESARGIVLKGRAPVAKQILRVRLPRPQVFTLENGLKILVVEDHTLPTVSLSLSVRAGSLWEPKPGVADLTASMLDEGTTSRSFQELSEQVESIGARLGSSAGTEYATVSASGLSEHTDTLVDLMADVLLNPAFPEDRLERVRFQAASSLAQRRSNPNFLAGELRSRILYGDTPYASLSPTAREIAAITRADLAAFHEKMYRPGGGLMGIAGDVQPSSVVDRIRRALAGWKPGAGEPALPPADFKAPDTAAIHLIDRPGSAQTVLSFAAPGITRTDPDYVALYVANRILGGGSSGRLFRNLREEKGFTYGAYSQLSTPKWIGIWGAGASVRTPVTEPAVQEFYREFRRIQEEPVTAEELESAKRSIIGSFARTLESPQGILARMMELVENGLPMDYWDTFPEKVQAVTADDVQRVSRKYLASGRIQLIAVGERAKIEEALKRFGPVRTENPLPAGG